MIRGLAVLAPHVKARRDDFYSEYVLQRVELLIACPISEVYSPKLSWESRFKLKHTTREADLKTIICFNIEVCLVMYLDSDTSRTLLL